MEMEQEKEQGDIPRMLVGIQGGGTPEEGRTRRWGHLSV